jgi:4-hydroxy-3-methylbut-2-enyl diphosphate reductase
LSKLTVCAPLGVEARALRRGLAASQEEVEVIRTGYGPVRAAAAAARIAASAPDMLAVGGVAGGLTTDQHVGDLVVASEVRDGTRAVRCPSAPLLAGELRRAGLATRTGPIVTVDHLLREGEHAQLAASGAIAVDMESAPLLAGAAGSPAVVLRAISDTPDHPLVSPHIVAGGLAALRSLRAAAPVLAQWAAAVGPRRVLLASPRSFCAGVERAIEIVELALEQHGAPVYVRKQIVHNATVVADLERAGAIFVDELSEVPDGAMVVFSAHGVSPEVRQEAAQRGLDAVDATCPLVAKVHAEARRFAADGYLVALIGHAGHEEVDGTLGEAPDAMALVETTADVAGLRPADPGKVAYLMQTTLAADEASGIVDAITSRFPAATTSATPPPTGNAQCGPSRRDRTWSWWPARSTPPTLSASSRPPSAPGPRPTWSTVRRTSSWPGSPAPRRSGSRPGHRHPRRSSARSWRLWAALARFRPRTSSSPPSPFSSGFRRSCASRQLTWADDSQAGSHSVTNSST